MAGSWATLPRLEMVDTVALTYQGVPVDVAASAFGQLQATDAGTGDFAGWRRQLGDQGYLYVPQLLDRDDVLAARRELLRRLAELDQLSEAMPVHLGIARRGVSSSSAHQLAEDNPDLDRVIYGERMMGFFGGLLGGAVRHFDFTWLRAKTPGHDTATHPHCDKVFMGRGSANLLTGWTPIGDCAIEMGGLMILEGSHQHPRVLEYVTLDVDEYCSNGPDAAAIQRGEQRWDRRAKDGAFGVDAIAVREELGGRWLTADFVAGDLLVFTINTIHASLDNQTDRFRLSSDSRYQLSSEPIDERWVGERPDGHGPGGKKAMIC